MKRCIVLSFALAAGAVFLQAQPKPKSQKEVEAIQAIFNAQDPDSRIAAAEKLLTNFADTEFKAIALQVAAAPVRQALCLAPDCAFCGQPGAFLRNEFLDRTPRRGNQRRRSERPRAFQVRHGQAVRVACAWAFETTAARRVGARQDIRHAVRTGGRVRGAAPVTPSA